MGAGAGPQKRLRQDRAAAAKARPGSAPRTRSTSNLDLIQRHRPDLVAVFAADHVYRMDVGQMVCFHEACGADVTVSAARVPIDRARAFGVLATGPTARSAVSRRSPKRRPPIPDDPAHAYVSMGNYLFDPDVLAGLLLAGQSRGATDFGHDILPRLPGRQRIYAYDFARNFVPGRPAARGALVLARRRHARSVAGPRRTTSSGREPLFNLSNAHWPIHGAGEPCMSVAGRGACPPKGRAWSALRLKRRPAGTASPRRPEVRARMPAAGFRRLAPGGERARVFFQHGARSRLERQAAVNVLPRPGFACHADLASEQAR